jgi:hypothetical protein
MVPSIGGGMNRIFTPVFLRSDGVGEAAGATVGEAEGVADGVGETTAITVTVAGGVGVDDGAGEGSCAVADRARERSIGKTKRALRTHLLSNFEFRISNFSVRFK